MQVSVIVHVIGPDRPGLVEQLSAVIRAASGNWEGSRLVQLAGQFSGMVQVVIEEEKVPALRDSLAELEDSGLHTSIAHITKGDEETASDSGLSYDLEVVGQDRQGIVAVISKTLAAEGVNVVELTTDCTLAPWSGERLFKTNARLLVPDSIDAADLLQKIETIAGDLMVELHPAELEAR
ncbi:MAG: glycine cleavage system protein R [Verrucomicrobiales bacterium]|nr:glycine cleavage system protein R [Verrucomicrobiales bacterium]